TEVRLNFPAGTIWEWDPPSDGQFEQHSKGSKDFYFENDNTMPIEVGLKSKSCKCSDVLVGIVPAAEVPRYREAALAKKSDSLAQLSTMAMIVDDLKGVTVKPGEGGVVRL